MNKNIENSVGKEINLNRKNPSSMFFEPVHVGKCPLCEGDTYSENDPSNDPSMSVRCCECDWNVNQFLTWEEMNGMVDDFKKSYEKGVTTEERPEGEFEQLLIVDEFHNFIGQKSAPSMDYYSEIDKEISETVYNKKRKLNINTREEAMKVINRIPNNALAGKDVNSISDNDIIDLANDLLDCERESFKKN